MVAYQQWATPAAGDVTATSDSLATVSYANGYWFATGDGAAPSLRVASDPRGTWSTVSIPALPTGYAAGAGMTGRVLYAGGVYAFLMQCQGTSGFEQRVLYSSSPTGTWTAYDFTPTGDYRMNYDTLAHDGTNWIAAGNLNLGPSVPHPAFIAYSPTISGTWTVNTSTASTGYDVSSLAGGEFRQIQSIVYDGTNYTSCAWTNAAAGDLLVMTSTSLTGGWSAPTSIPAVYPDWSILRHHSNGYTTLASVRDSVGDSRPLYTTSPTGTWTQAAAGALGMEDVNYLDYASGVWLASGLSPSLDQTMTYLLTPAAPSGTWTDVPVTGLGSDWQPVRIAHDAARFVYGHAPYARIQFALTTAVRYLRQRQSPKASPTRQRQRVITRQRQTP